MDTKNSRSGAAMRQRRMNLGLSREALAAKTGASFAVVVQFENGKYSRHGEPIKNSPTIDRIFAVLGELEKEMELVNG